MFNKLKEKLFFKLLENRKKAALLHLLKDKTLINNYVVENGQNNRIEGDVNIDDCIILNLQINNCAISGNINIWDSTIDKTDIRYNTWNKFKLL